jgi:hypothetical protein
MPEHPTRHDAPRDDLRVLPYVLERLVTPHADGLLDLHE